MVPIAYVRNMRAKAVFTSFINPVVTSRKTSLYETNKPNSITTAINRSETKTYLYVIELKLK